MEFTKVSSCGSNNNGVKLLDAATEGRADDAVELLTQDPILILIADAMGDTAFHIAARAGHGSTVLMMMEFLKLDHIELLKKALRKGNANGDRPLHLALKNGHKDFAFDLAKEAMMKNYDKDAMRKINTLILKNNDGKDAFDLAKEAGIHLSFDYLSSDNAKEAGIYVSYKNEYGSSEDEYERMDFVDKDGCKLIERVVRLTLAERSETFYMLVGFCKFLSTFVDLQMKIARTIENDDERLYEAAKSNEENVVIEILERDPNNLEWKEQSSGRTALHAAACSGNMGPLKKMVEFMQCNSNLKKLLLEGDNNESVPLHLALEYGHEKVARYLVEVAPRAVYKEDQSGSSPLKLAIDYNYPDLVSYMVRADLSQAIRDRLLEHANKIGIVNYVLKKRNLAIFQALLEGLPDLVSIPDKKGWRLLSYVAYKSYIDEVSYILNRFPDSTRKADVDESFPIHKAVAGGHISVVKEFLLHCPQALQDIDREGRNLVEIATLCKKNDVLSYLKEINK